MSYSPTLSLPKGQIQRCRQIAHSIGHEVGKMVKANSTVGIERAVLRLLGFEGALEVDNLLYPSVNRIVDQLLEADRLGEGALYWVANAALQERISIAELDKRVCEGSFHLGNVSAAPDDKIRQQAKKLASAAYQSLTKKIEQRKKLRKSLGDPAAQKRPLKYVIVATGNIFEDVLQARAAVFDGADVIAVIRSTAQSLLDYVPQGTTTVGFGGTYATQGNFRVMREALDDIGKEVKRYIRLTNYASGLCMAEIAALGALEGLDCLLNDAMYGILFRDINVCRTLIDQHFSRLICAKAGIWIMTGEDNYLKTTDAIETGHTVLASQFINEQTALNANTPYDQMAIGHAMEMNPEYENVILMEIARAQMTRQIFPKSPLKYMCNTKFKSGDIFTSHAYDTVFNLIGALTQQGVLLLGMLTEAVHTPFLQDRSLAIRDANYILGGLSKVSGEFGFRTDGFLAKHAQSVLKDTVKFLEKVDRIGFLQSIAKGDFAGVRRTVDGGKGKEGVYSIDSKRYLNPFYGLFGSRL